MKQESTTLACPTCHRELLQRTSKKRKPYFVCEFCGVQIFFRFQEGIERLRESVGSISGDDFVLCRACQVAVRRSKDSLSHPIFGAKGIYCPKCDQLLLKADAVGRRIAGGYVDE